VNTTTSDSILLGQVTKPVQTDWSCSPTLGELFGAMSKARGEMDHLITSRKVQTRKYSYTFATLANSWDVIREPFAANGLALIQLPLPREGNTLALLSILGHSSGEFITCRSTMELHPKEVDPGEPPKPPTPQDEGQLYTYLRRYALNAIAGLYNEDDDANHASGKAATITPRGPKARTKPAAPSAPQAFDPTAWPTAEIAEDDRKSWEETALIFDVDNPPDPPTELGAPEMPPWGAWAYRLPWSKGMLAEKIPAELLHRGRIEGSEEHQLLRQARALVRKSAAQGKRISEASYIPVLLLAILERHWEVKP